MVEGVRRFRLKPLNRGKGISFGSRPKQRRGDEKRRQGEEDLAQDEQRRMHDVIKQSAHRRGAVAGIGKGQEVRLQQPQQMRRRDQKRNAERQPGSGRGQGAPRPAIEQHEQRIGGRQHDDEIFGPERPAEGQAEEQPGAEAFARQRQVKGVAGERPERQLHYVVIEFHRGVLEIMHAVDDQHGDQRAHRADDGPRGGKDENKGDDHHRLRQRVISSVAAEQPVGDLDQPPGQWRQLVVTELPFAAIGEGLDEIERQVGVKQARQRGPNREMHGQEGAECRLRPALDPADQPGRWNRIGRRFGRRHGCWQGVMVAGAGTDSGIAWTAGRNWRYKGALKP